MARKWLILLADCRFAWSWHGIGLGMGEHGKQLKTDMSTTTNWFICFALFLVFTVGSVAVAFAALLVSAAYPMLSIALIGVQIGSLLCAAYSMYLMEQYA